MRFIYMFRWLKFSSEFFPYLCLPSTYYLLVGREQL